MKNNLLIFSGGNLAYAIATKLNKCVLINKIFIVCLKNKLFIEEANTIVFTLSEITDYKTFIEENDINFVVVFNEALSQTGFVNFLKYKLNIPVIGITKYWNRLETSKRFAKDFMVKNNIPTPQYSVINDFYGLKKALEFLGLPVVLKIDGLMQGFGSFICRTEKECFNIAKMILKDNKFFIAEKFIKGKEVTLHTIWDGNVLIPLECIKDYKKSLNNDKGINTGSLGSYIPVELSNNQKKLINEYVKNLEKIFIERKPNFTGIFASDLIFTENQLFNLEFNMRPCIPEFEVFLEHINNSIFEVLYNIASGNCKNLKLEYKKGITGCVNIVHKDYIKHKNFDKKKLVKLPAEFFNDNCKIKINKSIISLNPPSICSANGQHTAGIRISSRILSLINTDLNDPFPLIYEYAEKIKDKNLYYRTDIGK